MRGFCQKCTVTKEISGIETIRLPNLSYINKGTCPDCGGPIYVKLYDKDILISRSGFKAPKEIYVSENTPARIQKIQIGQTLIQADKTVELKPKEGTKIQTVHDVIQQEGMTDAKP